MLTPQDIFRFLFFAFGYLSPVQMNAGYIAKQKSAVKIV